MTQTATQAQNDDDALAGLDHAARARAVDWRTILLRVLIVAVILAMWEFLPVSRGIKFWLSSPSAIIAMLADWVVSGTLWPHLQATLTAMVSGYLIGTVTGIGFGVLLGFLPFMHRVFLPYISALYALPKIALAPLFIILFGIGIASKIALVAITVFFLLLYSTTDGIRDVDRDLIQSLRLMGATRLEIMRKVLLPGSLPWIFTGARISVRYAFTGTLLAELIAANQGIGFLIEYHSGNFDSTGTYAAVLVLVIFSVTLTEILSRVEAGASHRGS